MVPIKFHEHGEMTMTQNSKKALDDFDTNQWIDFSVFHTLCQEATSVFEKYHSYQQETTALKKIIETEKTKNYDILNKSIQKNLHENYYSYFLRFSLFGIIVQYLFFWFFAALGYLEIDPIVATLPLIAFELLKTLFIFFQTLKLSKNFQPLKLSKKMLFSFSVLLVIFVFLEVALLQNYIYYMFTIYLFSIVISRFISNALPFIRMKKLKKDLEEKAKQQQEELEKASQKDRDAIKQAIEQLQALREIYPELKQKYEARKEIYEIMKNCAYTYVDAYNKIAILIEHKQIAEKSKNDKLSLKTQIDVMHIIANLTLQQYNGYYTEGLMTSIHKHGQTFEMWCEDGIKVHLAERQKFWEDVERRERIRSLSEYQKKSLSRTADNLLEYIDKTKNQY